MLKSAVLNLAFHNGSKSLILNTVVIGNLFVPLMEHNLRNGIGHH